MATSEVLVGGGTSESGAGTWRRYSGFLRTPPELVVRWRDRETTARGYLIINSLRGGAAGGGTRMRPGVSRREVVYLAKAMELKFSLTGPPIGGAKAGIDFDPRDPRKGDVLERWYRAISPYLRSCYGTGGDLNVDEVADVLPAFARLGLRHPQEGVVRGHLRPDEAGFERVIAQLDAGVRAPVDGGAGIPGRALTVADLITGYGVARSVERFHASRGLSMEGQRVSVEGFGNVGAAAALYLARAGGRITAISDAEKWVEFPGGLDATEVEELVRRSEDKLVPGGAGIEHRGEGRRGFDATPADMLIAAALSGTIDAARLGRLEAAGVGVIGCGANQPFAERAIGSTLVARDADSRFSVVGDILANCGMARAFSYLMQEGSQASAAPIFAAVDATLDQCLEEVNDRSGGRATGLLASAFALALDRVA